MKKLFVLLAAIAASVSVSVSAGTPVNESELPQAAKTFISTHFSGVQIKKVVKDQGRRGMEFEVDFVGGAEVDFTSDGNWKEVKAAKGNAVPAAVVPAAIAKYVADNFSGQAIVEISRKRGGFEVELANGTELKLTEDAKPMPAPQRGEGPRGNGPRGERPRGGNR